MEFTNTPTERTTAATDTLLAIIALVSSLYLRQLGQAQPWKLGIWVWAFSLLAIVAALGAVVHGFKLPDNLKTYIWYPTYLLLSMLVSLLMVAATYDVWGQATAQRLLPPLIGVGVIFFVATLIWPNTFAVFTIYQAVTMSFALGGYVWLALGDSLTGAWWMVAGVLVTVIAAGVQAGQSVSFTCIWPFDHNGVYHLIQMVGVLLLVVGLRAAFVSEASGVVALILC